MIEVSLVICTRNRADRLERCLAAISAIATSVSWELIVVDNASADETSAVLHTYQKRVAFPVVLLHEPVPGSGRAKNIGWQAAQGKIIAFTDDDCYVSPDYIDRIIAVFATPKLGFCGGRIMLHDPDDYPVTIRESTTPDSYPPGRVMAAGEIQGANMIFRRAVLEQIDGFDADFGAGTRFACEDVCACARASFAGWHGAYAPSIVVGHHHGRKAAAALALKRSYALGSGAYMMKFLIRRDTRASFARYWRWQLLRRLLGSEERRRECFWEVRGALNYLLYRANSARIARGSQSHTESRQKTPRNPL